jgi:hypothetical protein
MTHSTFGGARPVVVLDLMLLAWVILWVLLGLAVASELRGLSALSDTVSETGAAVRETGATLRGFEGLPFGIGDRVQEPARSIEAAGASAQRSGRESRASIRDLSVLLGVSVAVMPSVPILFLYVPWRLGLLRERRALRQALRDARDEPALIEFLARRASERLPYDRLRQISDSPWRDLEEGRHRELAAAEIERLGLERRLVRPRRPRMRR